MALSNITGLTCATSLFSRNQVWSLASLRYLLKLGFVLRLTPSNIIARFRKCGIHPFNREAIPTTHEVTAENTQPSDPASDERACIPPVQTSEVAPQFTSKQIEVFNTRFVEGYNIYSDADYVSWLRLNHPTAIPHEYSDVQSIRKSFLDITPLDMSGSSSTPVTDSDSSSPSMTNFGSSFSVMNSESDTTSHIPSPSRTSRSIPGTGRSTATSQLIGGVSTIPSRLPDMKNQKVNPLTKYLQLPKTIDKLKESAASFNTRAVTGARVLTSAGCLAILCKRETEKKERTRTGEIE